MLIEKDGQINHKVVDVILTNGKGEIISLDKNQFFQWTPTGKRLELWEGKKEFLDYKNNGITENETNIKRVCFWNYRSVGGFCTLR